LVLLARQAALRAGDNLTVVAADGWRDNHLTTTLPQKGGGAFACRSEAAALTASDARPSSKALPGNGTVTQPVEARGNGVIIVTTVAALSLRSSSRPRRDSRLLAKSALPNLIQADPPETALGRPRVSAQSLPLVVSALVGIVAAPAVRIGRDAIGAVLVNCQRPPT